MKTYNYFLIAVCTLLIACQASYASRILFSGGYHHLIREIDTTTHGIKDLVTIEGNLSSLYYEPANQSIYWAVDSGYGAVGRYDTQTQQNVTLIDGQVIGRARIGDITLWNDRIYFSDSYNGGIFRSDLSGQSVRTIISPDNAPWGPSDFAIDTINRKLYWFESGFMNVSNMDGSSQQVLFGGNCRSIFIEETTQKLYWSTPSSIQRANLDGSNIETVATSTFVITDFGIDPLTRDIFWVAYNSSNHHSVMQGLYAGQSTPVIVADFGYDIENLPGAMYVIPEPGTMGLVGVGTLALLKKKVKGKRQL